MKYLIFFIFVFFANSSFAVNEFSNIDLPDHIIGDIGAAAYSTHRNIATENAMSHALPYAFFDYKRAFVRVDELGLKAFKMGYGYFELVGKVSLDSYRLKSLMNASAFNRNSSIPIGVGTFQETPIGAIAANAFHDFGKSHGALYELLYFAEVETYKKIIIYPQIGIERQSNQFANYYYGITSGESVSTGYGAYVAPASNNIIAGMMVEIPIVDNWHVNIYGKRKWIGSGIYNSPILNRSFQDTIFAALAYRFK